MAKQSVRIVGDRQREHAIDLIRKAPVGNVMTLGEETRTDRQNRLMWPLIKDCREQIAGFDAFTPDQCKLRFLNALDNEMQMLPHLDGSGFFVVGQRSSKLTKAQFADLIEVIYAYGARHDVKWSARSQETFEETRKG